MSNESSNPRKKRKLIKYDLAVDPKIREEILMDARDYGVRNVKKMNAKWKGHDVYCPCGKNGERICIGSVCYVVMGDEIKAYFSKDAEKIEADILKAGYVLGYDDDEEDEEPDDDEEIAPEDIYNS